MLSAAILTLARRPDSTLVELPLLLSDNAFRRAVTKTAVRDDPLGTGTFWTAFDQLSDGARAQVIAPVMTRLRQWLTMPSLQATLGQTRPRITIREAIARGKLLLVPLQPGKLGAQVAALISALVLHEVWIAMQERVHLPEADRKPVAIIIDEVGSFLKSATDLGDMLVLTRSLGGALTLSHQHLGQLGTDLQAAIEANAASRIMFQLGPRDAAAIAKGDPQLTAEDFTALPPFGIYARLLHDNRVGGWASGRTLAPSPPICDPEDIRRRSRDRYARPVAEVAAEILARVNTPAATRTAGRYGRQERPS